MNDNHMTIVDIQLTFRVVAALIARLIDHGYLDRDDAIDIELAASAPDSEMPSAEQPRLEAMPQLSPTALEVRNHMTARRIVVDKPIAVIEGMLRFAAEDDCGAFELWVPTITWEEHQSTAPLPADSDDRRDHALDMLEAAIANRDPMTSRSGLRVLLL